MQTIQDKRCISSENYKIRRRQVDGLPGPAEHNRSFENSVLFDLVGIAQSVSDETNICW